MDQKGNSAENVRGSSADRVPVERDNGNADEGHDRDYTGGRGDERRRDDRSDLGRGDERRRDERREYGRGDEGRRDGRRDYERGDERRRDDRRDSGRGDDRRDYGRRDRSRSPDRRDYRRDRDYDRDRNDRRGDSDYSYSRSQPKRAAVPPQNNSNRFWDGFQWVDRDSSRSDEKTALGAVVTGVAGLPKDRRIYVGNLPDGTDTEHLKSFMNQTLQMCGAVPAEAKSAVLSLWMSADNKYGFMEMCSSDCATVAMGLNGINYNGVALKIARPKTYAAPPGMIA